MLLLTFSSFKYNLKAVRVLSNARSLHRFLGDKRMYVAYLKPLGVSFLGSIRFRV